LKGEVFIDSGAFIAFLLRSDRFHEEVTELFARPPKHWLISSFVISETYSWFLHRRGEDAARSFQKLLDDMPGLQVLDGDPHHRAAVWKKLDALRGVKLTWVDASSLVWLETREIETVWGTDHHLAVEGARVLPRASLG